VACFNTINWFIFFGVQAYFLGQPVYIRRNTIIGEQIQLHKKETDYRVPVYIPGQFSLAKLRRIYAGCDAAARVGRNRRVLIESRASYERN